MRSIQSCYVSAPVGLDISGLRNLLSSKGIDVRVATSVWGAEVDASIGERIESVDLVVGVLTRERNSQWVLFELGKASALRKQILLIAYPSAGRIPAPYDKMLVVRSNLTNLQAVEFVLDQLLAAPPMRAPDKSKLENRIPDKDQLLPGTLSQLASAANWGDPIRFEELVATALRGAGADVVTESKSRERGADLAVWSDSWGGAIGNPMLVEVKNNVISREQAEATVRQLSQYIDRSGSSLGLLVVGQGSEFFERLPKSQLKRIAVMTARGLADGLGSKGLGELILSAVSKQRLL